MRYMICFSSLRLLNGLSNAVNCIKAIVLVRFTSPLSKIFRPVKRPEGMNFHLTIFMERRLMVSK